MAEVSGADPIFRSKRKAINALFPYAVRLAQDGQQRMIDAILRVALKSTSGGFMWRRIRPYITTLFDESRPLSLNQAIVLASPCADWIHGPYTQSAVARWTAAALTTLYSEEVDQSVVDALLLISHNGSLRPHIPIEIWALLKRRPSLPPASRGRYWGTTSDILRHIRRLGDIEILKSYFLLVWSEWDLLFSWVDAQVSIEEDFSGIGMWCHRESLIDRLDHILGRLDRGLEYFKQHKPWFDEYDIQFAQKKYGELREVLLEVDREAMKTLSRTFCVYLFQSVG